MSLDMVTNRSSTAKPQDILAITSMISKQVTKLKLDSKNTNRMLNAPEWTTSLEKVLSENGLVLYLTSTKMNLEILSSHVTEVAIRKATNAWMKNALKNAQKERKSVKEEDESDEEKDAGIELLSAIAKRNEEALVSEMKSEHASEDEVVMFANPITLSENETERDAWKALIYGYV